ncbi:phage tail family protein [Bacillus sp. 3103sda1]|uniref:phage tail family protein n=1 Tax=Bacillus sp. 3103sda1 TaxID=2953808 RepID=UPI0020A06EFF|nr:phage tail family protein [Bacillus sp. 3103sda1]MCP1124558.1 phage tail family protein [Bacillus sp. 3103sda1]
MYLTIERMNGNKYILSKETGYFILYFRPESLQVNVNYEYIDGRDIPVEVSSQPQRRKIPMALLIESYDFPDFALKRNEFFQILDSREPFYVTVDTEPGKRWLVRADSFTPDHITTKVGRCNITLQCVSPYAESIGTTLDPMTFDSELWQIGQGLIAEDMLYKFSVTSFQVYNAGDVAINPKEPRMPLVIRVYGVTQNLSITNRTTGDVWQYTGETTASDVIELKGVRSLKNGVSIFGNTNYKLINIATGWNDFVIGGVTGPFNIEFDFRFYYL